MCEKYYECVCVCVSWSFDRVFGGSLCMCVCIYVLRTLINDEQIDSFSIKNNGFPENKVKKTL
jgi:hypothetical protein